MEDGGEREFCWGSVTFIILIGFGGSFLDKGAIYGGHFNKIHESSIFSKQ